MDASNPARQMALIRKTGFCSNLGKAEFPVSNHFDRPLQSQMNDVAMRAHADGSGEGARKMKLAPVRHFRERFPGVQVRLREIVPPQHAEALRSGSIDIAIEREPAPEEGVDTMPVLVESFVAALPRNHPLAGRRAIRVSALRDEPFVLFPRDVATGLYQKLFVIFRHAGFEPRVIQEADAWHTILSLVEAGIGVTIIPASLRKLRADALGFPALTGQRVRTTTTACSRAHEPSPIVNAFLELLRDAAR